MIQHLPAIAPCQQGACLEPRLVGSRLQMGDLQEAIHLGWG